MSGICWNRASTFSIIFLFFFSTKAMSFPLTKHYLSTYCLSGTILGMMDAKVIKTQCSFIQNYLRGLNSQCPSTLVLDLNGLFIFQGPPYPVPFSMVNTPPTATRNSLSLTLQIIAVFWSLGRFPLSLNHLVHSTEVCPPQPPGIVS